MSVVQKMSLVMCTSWNHSQLIDQAQLVISQSFNEFCSANESARSRPPVVAER